MTPFVWLEIFFVACVGLTLGSFATALYWRLPRGIPMLAAPADNSGHFARSACQSCKETLSCKDLVPLFSWIFLKGKCRCCAAPVGVAYPLIELATLAGCLGVYAVWGLTGAGLIVMAAVPLLVAHVAIDAEHMILPDRLNLALAGLAALLIFYQLAFYGADFGFGRQALFKLAGMAGFAALALAVGWLMGALLKKEALGMGDVKFFAVAGLWLGIAYLPFFLVLSGSCGIVFGLFYKVALKQERFPFGPALIVSLYACLLLQGLEIIPIVGVQ